MTLPTTLMERARCIHKSPTDRGVITATGVRWIPSETMPKRKATPLTVDEAKAQIDEILKKPVASWDGGDWRKRNDLASRLPRGVPNAGKLLATYDVRELGQLPAQLDDAVLAAIEARPKDPDAAFVLAALRTNPKTHVRDLLSIQLDWAARANRAVLAKLVKKRPDIVEGARAAFALQRPGYVTSVYLPVLVVEASRDSLDLIVPYVEQMVKDRDGELDWFRKEVVPLFGDTPAARDVIALLDGVVDERTKVSPARAFAKKLGMDPPPDVLGLTLSFRDRDGKTVWQIRVDSTLADWLQARRTEKWLWRSVTLAKASELPAECASYVLRVKSGDRRKLDAWAKSLLANVPR